MRLTDSMILNKLFSEKYKCIRLTTRLYGTQLHIYNTSTKHSVVLDRTVVVVQMYYNYTT